jgi:hypothetical protein
VNIFGSVISFLFKPKPEIFKRFTKLIDLYKDKSTVKIVIQIRTGDASLGQQDINTSFAVDHFFDCAKQIDKFNSKPSKWILFSDSIDIRKAAKYIYGMKKVFTPTSASIEHAARAKTTNEGYANAAAEWWLMGEADYFVLSENSGFGKTAAARNFHTSPTNVYLISLKASKSPSCGKNDFASLARLNERWSGL